MLKGAIQLAKVKLCQSCGMPLDDKTPAGTEKTVHYPKNIVITVIKMVNGL